MWPDEVAAGAVIVIDVEVEAEGTNPPVAFKIR
jgi:hypothetical protein